MKSFVKSLVALCVAAPIVTLNAAPAPSSTNTPAASKVGELFGNSIVAKGKGVSVSRAELDEEVVRLKASPQGRRLAPEMTPMLERQILQDLISLQLLKSKATAEEKSEAKATAQKRIEELKAQSGPEVYQARLKSINLTEDQFVEKTADRIIAETVLKRVLDINITEDQIKEFYAQNPGQFEQPEQVRAAHVLISTTDQLTNTPLSDEQKAAKKKIAEDVLKRARAGEDFAKLAKEYSDDPGSKDTGGEYTFARGKMVPEFEAAAFSLNTNQVSDIVQTQFGYHIIKLYEKLPAEKVELSKAHDRLKDWLTGRAMQQKLPDYIEKASKEAEVEILDEKLKPESSAPSIKSGE